MADDILILLQATFREEGLQILEQLESALLELEKTPPTAEQINKLFRLAHNFKGSSRSVGFTELADVAHKAEDLLTKVKQGELDVSPPVISALLTAADVLRQGLQPGASGGLSQRLESAKDGLAKQLKQSEAAPVVAVDAGFGLFDDPPQGVTPAPAVKLAQRPAAAMPQPLAATPAREPGAKRAEEFLRVNAAKLDQLLALTGELIVGQQILERMLGLDSRTPPPTANQCRQNGKIISSIQAVSMELRLVPATPLFQKLRRAIRDVATELGKDVEFVTEGEDVELDRTVLDRMTDAMTHMVRNAVDHGIETSEERVRLNKKAAATVFLGAYVEDNRVTIRLSDDGRGLNKEKIREKAVANGLVAPQAQLSDTEIHALIFRAGFSTKEVVTAVSGRGVGMEVVQTVVDDLKGSIDIDSVQGRGTEFRISLPLSLAVTTGMVVRSEGRIYVVPVSQLAETIELGRFSLSRIQGELAAIEIRGRTVPIYSLAALLKGRMLSGTSRPQRPAIVAMHLGMPYAFEVDEILGQEQVILKRLGVEFRPVPHILGGAILGDGEPSLVLDLPTLLKGGSRRVAS